MGDVARGSSRCVRLAHVDWGTLVAAALDGAAAGRKVWVDNVAVRQFPGNSADLDFGGVIARCAAVLVVAQALPGVAGLEGHKYDVGDPGARDGGTASRMEAVAKRIPAGERPLFAGCRVWCLVRDDKAPLPSLWYSQLHQFSQSP